MVFVSGQLPIDPTSGEITGSDPGIQARQAILNIEAILEAAGSDLTRVVKTTVLLVDMSHFDAVNTVYESMFLGEVLPARACYQVAALPKGALVEIEAIAVT